MVKLKTHMVIVLMGLALAGSIAFMPLHVNGQYTCLYHRFVDTSKPVAASMLENRGQQDTVHGHSIQYQQLVHEYLDFYAWFWWASLLVLVFSIHHVFNHIKFRRKRITR
ncbi:MAG: hypothetical protein GF313_08755 [Caldithrix sp.]|nr:hypothetical protein [Caldithrix sp.]